MERQAHQARSRDTTSVYVVQCLYMKLNCAIKGHYIYKGGIISCLVTEVRWFSVDLVRVAYKFHAGWSSKVLHM